MGAKKVKVETILDDGTKIMISINGTPSRQKMTKYLDLLELMGSGIVPNQIMDYDSKEIENLTISEQLLRIIKSKFLGKSFNINDINREFEKEYGLSIKRSTLATYLSRMVDQNILERNGRRCSYIYNTVLSKLV